MHASLSVPEDEQIFSKRIYAHLLIKDPYSAVLEAKQSLAKYPDSKTLHFAYIRALCESGHDAEALEHWRKSGSVFGEEHKGRHLIETLAWGVLNNGENSKQLPIRVNALLGAAFTNDAKAVPLLLMYLKGSNAWLRSVAVRLAASYGDAVLQDEIARLLKHEKIWYVRLEAIKAIGQLRILKMRQALKELIGNPKTLVEEKGAAIVALVSMYDQVDREELKKLINSPRAGLRELACEIISHLNLKEHTSILVDLLKDTSQDVRLAALNALGLMRIEKYKEQPIIELIEEALNDPVPEVAITAAWVGVVLGKERGLKDLEKWLRSEDSSLRRLSAAALSVAGKNGVELSLKMMQESKDPFVQANLAIGLIGQRQHDAFSCDTLFNLLSQEKKELWMWDNSYNPLFRSLSPSRVHHIDQVPNYPVVIDQMVSLDLLSVLSMMRYPRAQEAVKHFLKQQSWGITGAAAATLLQEGDDEAMQVVRSLLDDPDEKIRVQAAFILAIVGGDPLAVKVLQEVYPHMEREMKVHILEAIANIGDVQSIPFLIDILNEPFQVLRVVAASALIQCIYH